MAMSTKQTDKYDSDPDPCPLHPIKVYLTKQNKAAEGPLS